MAIDSTKKAIRIIFLDFRKAFDLNNHNKLLEPFFKIGVGRELVAWFASYLQGRFKTTTFQGEESNLKRIYGGVPQGTKLGPISFILKLNDLSMISRPDNDAPLSETSDEQDAVMCIEDTTSYGVMKSNWKMSMV